MVHVYSYLVWYERLEASMLPLHALAQTASGIYILPPFIFCWYQFNSIIGLITFSNQYIICIYIYCIGHGRLWLIKGHYSKLKCEKASRGCCSRENTGNNVQRI